MSAGVSREKGPRYSNADDSSILPYSLWDNELGEVGGTAVAKALETNTSLQNLK